MSLIGERIETALSTSCTEGCVRRVFKSFVSLEPVEESPGQVELQCPVQDCGTNVSIDVQLRDDGGVIPVGVRFMPTEPVCLSGLIG